MTDTNEQPTDLSPRRTIGNAVQTGKRIFLFIGAAFVLYVMMFKGPNQSRNTQPAENTTSTFSNPKHTATTTASAAPEAATTSEEEVIPSLEDYAKQLVAESKAKTTNTTPNKEDLSPEAIATHIVEGLQEPYILDNQDSVASQTVTDTENSYILALQNRIAELEAERTANEQNQQIQVVGNASRLEAISEQMDKLAAKQQEQSDQIVSLKKELKHSQRVTQQQQNVITSLTLLEQMRSAIEKGDSYRASLDQLRELHRENAALQRYMVDLSGHAASGIYTLDALKNEFDILLNTALKNTMTDSLSSNLKRLVQIRKVGEHHKGGDLESVLARAEAQLKNNQLQKAIQTLDVLPPEDKRFFTAWQQQATHYLDVTNALHAIERIMMNDLKRAADAPAKPKKKRQPDA